MELTYDIFKKIAPSISEQLRREHLKWLNVYFWRYEINTELRIACWFGHAMVECQRFTSARENLNYSASRLRAVWPKRFPTLAIANQYAHNPKALANYVYGSRLGNQKGTDDGWIFRGGGDFQTTGRSNYKEEGDHIGVDLETHPELIEVPRFAAWSACYEFKMRSCNQLADKRDMKTSCERINGGHNGLADRIAYFDQVMAWLPDGFKLSEPQDFAALYNSPTSGKVVAAKASDLPPQEVIDLGTPSWHEPDESEPSDSPQTAPNEAGDTNTPEPAKTPSNDLQSPANEPLESGKPEPQPVTVDKEGPSTFTKWLTAIKVAVGTLLTSATAYCGGEDIKTKIADKAIENADRSVLLDMLPIIIYVLLGCGAGVFLIWIASVFYDRSAERSNKLNAQKIEAAANQSKNTVELGKG